VVLAARRCVAAAPSPLLNFRGARSKSILVSPHRQAARRKPLGEILVEEGWATAADVEQALIDQPHISQRLASLLVNRGLLDPDHAARALGRQHAVPAALLRHLAARDPAIADALPPDVAHAYSALALAVARDRTVIVCVRDPDRPELRLALEHALGRPVTLVVACDAALLPLIREVYGDPPDDFEIDMSFEAAAEAGGGPASSESGDFDAFVSGTFTLADLDDERVVRDPSQVGAGPTLRGAPAAVPSPAGASSAQGRAPAPELEQPTWLPGAAASLPAAAASSAAGHAALAPAAPPSPSPPSSPPSSPPTGPAGEPAKAPSPPALAPGPLVATASAAMARARRKDELLDATFSALTPAWAAAVLFSVKDSAALGQRGFGGLLTPHAVDTLVIPLHSPSLLRRAWQSRVLIESEGGPGGAVQDRLLRLLGSPAAYAVSVEVAGRVVGLLAAAAPRDPGAPSALVALAHHLGQHFGRIIRAAKSAEAAESA
jgi:hypothetical protein